MQFNGLLECCELLPMRDAAQQCIEIFAGLLVDGSTLVANQHDGLMGGVGMTATHKGVETFDSVDQTMGQEKIQGAIDSRGLDRIAFSGETTNQFIGLRGFVIGPYFFQNGPPDRGQPSAACQADRFGMSERSGRAMRVIGAGHKMYLWLFG